MQNIAHIEGINKYSSKDIINKSNNIKHNEDTDRFNKFILKKFRIIDTQFK